MEYMTFDDFNRLVCRDRVIFLEAMKMLLENGRKKTLDSGELELISMMELREDQSVTDPEISQIAAAAKRLAALDSGTLTSYIKESGFNITESRSHYEGTCPVCGGSIEYQKDVPIDDGGYYKWTCPKCGASGREGYDKVFDRHYNVFDGDGNPYPCPDGEPAACLRNKFSASEGGASDEK